MSDLRVIFDRGPLKEGSAFRAPRDLIRADHPDEVPAALARMEAAQAAGHWLAGYAGYELGYVLSPKLRDLLPERREIPLMSFGVFDAPSRNAGLEPGVATLTPPEAAWSFEIYSRAFASLHDDITRGEIYQANLTFPMHARRTGSVDALYALLRARQHAPHGALVDLGGPVLLSRSPELFFSLDASGNLAARPMKGTVARGASPQEDAERIAWMQGSVKNRAENLMIVDLLRNDMSRIAGIGSVKVPQLYTVETYATLHQMTSLITARLRSGVGLAEIFEALFPCGSITGAPKIRAMQILRGLEDTPRDAYCGAIGWIAPDGGMTFNVAIRTLICHPDGRVRLNVGGGIVHDSSAREEYDEALLKARFAML